MSKNDHYILMLDDKLKDPIYIIVNDEKLKERTWAAIEMFEDTILESLEIEPEGDDYDRKVAYIEETDEEPYRKTAKLRPAWEF